MSPVSDYVFVWEDGPGDTHGFTPLVRAANGGSRSNPQGFDYARNYDAWCKAAGKELPAWDYLYPGSDAAAAGELMAATAGDAPLYVLDIEDADIPASAVESYVEKLPAGKPVYLSTWGTLGQAQARGIPYGARGFTGIWPQAYFDYQCPAISAWRASHYTTWPTFSPADYAGWADFVDASPFAIWRYGVVDLAAASEAAATARAKVAAPGKDSPVSEQTVDDTIHEVNQQGKAGQLDDAIRRGLTIFRDQYNWQSVVNHLVSIDAGIKALVAANPEAAAHAAQAATTTPETPAQ